MIRVTIEIVPHGDEGRARVIGSGTIINDGTGTPDSGNYEYNITFRDHTVSGKYTGYPRGVHGPWYLLFKILQQVFKNKEAVNEDKGVS